MGTGIKRVQAATVVFLLAISGFAGIQPAVATETNPVPGTEEPGPGDGSTEPVIPPIIPPVIPAPSPSPLEPEPAPSAQPPQVPDPAPIQPSTPVEVPAPVAPPVAPTSIPVAPAAPLPVDPGAQTYVMEPEAPTESEATTAAVEETVSPTPTPTPTVAAVPPVASADIAGPLKVALAPVAENNPLAQGLMVLVLILLGVAYFRALRTKGLRGPRLNGK